MQKIILCILLTTTLSITSQERGISKKFFTTEKFRVGLVVGADASWAGDNGKTGLIKNTGTFDDDRILYDEGPNTTFFLGMTAYSPTSTLGFITGVGLNFQEYSITDEAGVSRDSISTRSLEIPLYLRFRIGNALSRSQFWIAGGGGYSLVNKATTVPVDSNNRIGQTINVEDNFNSLPYLSGIIGYEFMAGNDTLDELNRDTLRFLLYAKVNYDLDNRISVDNAQNFENPSLEFLRISFGIKVMLRLSKAGEILGDTLMK